MGHANNFAPLVPAVGRDGDNIPGLERRGRAESAVVLQILAHIINLDPPGVMISEGFFQVLLGYFSGALLSDETLQCVFIQIQAFQFPRQTYLGKIGKFGWTTRF